MKYFEVTAKDTKDQYIADMLQKMLDSDRHRDMLGLPRKGREPDYFNGRWCVRCHNSLPLDWVEPCDVCGAATVFQGSLHGLLIIEREQS